MDELFDFAEEAVEEKKFKKRNLYDILIVDDDEDVHVVTKAALKNFTFEESGLNFIDAYSGKEAIDILSKKNKIAVILLDVVMESDDSGLKVAKAIRTDLKNNLIRIVLRTGQPGSAPEKDTIINYDINDYKDKSELSATKLFTTIYTALRSYRDLKKLSKNKEGLEKIIKYSKSLFQAKPMREFASGVLQQLSSLMQNNGNGALFIYYDSRGEKNVFEILASTSSELEKIDEKLKDELLNAIKMKKDIINESYYIGYFDLDNRNPHLVFLDNVNEEALKDEKHLVDIFVKNISIAFENVYLHQDLVDIQKELIYSLSDLAESKSKETARHIERVSYGSKLLAKLYGLSQSEQEFIKLAAPMHDIGKIVTPEHILHKKGRLTEEEMEVMKMHSYHGAQVFKKSQHKILQLASDIAISHHENYDGTGYPNQLKGEEISIYGRIVSLIDVFDALTHNRCYKKAWRTEEAVSFISQNGGKKFDPNLTQIFLENINQFIAINEEYKDPE